MLFKLRRYILPVFLIVFLLLPITSLRAEQTIQYTIEKIILEPSGLTNPIFLRRSLGLESRPYTFTDEAGMVEFANGIKQKLNNMRIFDEISYSLERSEAVQSYTLRFDIEDSFTMLPLPYGKYDSNYGYKLGVKLFDYNLLGTLTELKLTSNVRQVGNTWEEKAFFTSLELDHIPFFGKTMDIDSELNIVNDEGAWKYGSLTTSFSIPRIDLLGQNLSLSVSTDSNQISTTTDWYHSMDGTLSWKNIPYGKDRTFTFTSAIAIDQDSSDLSEYDSDLTLKTTFNNLDLEFTKFDMSIGMTLENLESSEPWMIDTIFITTGDSYTLPWNIRFAPSLELDFGLSDEDIDATLRNTLSYNKINWKGNLRRGLSFSISNTLSYDLDYLFDKPEVIPNYTILKTTAFIMPTSWMNLGFRANGIYAAGNDISFMNDSSIIPAEYLRGILNTSMNDYTGNLALTTNSHLMLKVIDIDGHVEMLGSAFFDFGIFQDSDTLELDTYYAAGIEGICIFDDYRSYPFNVSVGANLKDVASWMQKEISFAEIEYEISMSLELFY